MYEFPVFTFTINGERRIALPVLLYRRRPSRHDSHHLPPVFTSRRLHLEQIINTFLWV